MAFHIFSGLSLAMFVGVALLWLRSYGEYDYDSDGIRDFEICRPSSSDTVEVVDGQLAWHHREPPNTVGVFNPIVDTFSMGFSFHRYSYYSNGPNFGWVLSVPFWSLALCTLLLPMWWFRLILRQRRRAMRGLCSACGYDLRATPERCPECGKVV